MSTTEIARYDIPVPDVLDDFAGIIHSIEFKFNTNHLLMAGIRPGEINEAVSRAMRVCRLNAVETTEHFRPLYIFDKDQGNTYCDWKMTRQGFTLVLMNAPVTHMAIAQWQWQVINTLSSSR